MKEKILEMYFDKQMKPAEIGIKVHIHIILKEMGMSLEKN